VPPRCRLTAQLSLSEPYLQPAVPGFVVAELSCTGVDCGQGAAVSKCAPRSGGHICCSARQCCGGYYLRRLHGNSSTLAAEGGHKCSSRKPGKKVALASRCSRNHVDGNSSLRGLRGTASLMSSEKIRVGVGHDARGAPLNHHSLGPTGLTHPDDTANTVSSGVIETKVATPCHSCPQWPRKPVILGKTTYITMLSSIAEWILVLAPLMFIGTV
jgi:hypothetical protein